MTVFFLLRLTSFGFVHGTESVQVLLELWLGATRVTIDGKKRQFDGKKFMDLAVSPIVFKHVKRKWDVKIGADAATKELLIHINGVAYDDLPEFDDQGIYACSVEHNWKGTVK